MFAESPGLNAVEHAVYDVWLKGCKQNSDVPAPEAGRRTDAGLERSPVDTISAINGKMPFDRRRPSVTTTQKDLLALEKKFWTGDSTFYRQNVDDSYVDGALPATVVERR